MAILAIFTGPGVDKENYEAIRNEVKWETDHPAGLLFHAASFDEEGHAHIVDLWETPEELEHFFGHRIMPALHKLDLTAPTAVTYTLHNANILPGAAKYLIK